MAYEIFGPVQSRRLGYSLGINHLPEKICSYSCVYCQIGRTTRMSIHRRNYGDPDEICRLTGNRIDELAKNHQAPDTITLVPNGEPTLDKNISGIIRRLKELGFPVAVISNASLLWMPEVREEIRMADTVSVKIDSVEESLWKQINRPHGSLRLETVLEGIVLFSRKFTGNLITETMLLKGVNDQVESAKALAMFLSGLGEIGSYLSLPLRPPAENHITPPDVETVQEFIQTMEKFGVYPVLMKALPDSEVTKSQGKISDLLRVIKVHPLKESEFNEFLIQQGIPQKEVDALLKEKIILKKKTENQVFYSYNHAKQGSRNKSSELKD